MTALAKTAVGKLKANKARIESGDCDMEIPSVAEKA